MKNPFSNKDSKFLIFLLIFISILSIRSGRYTSLVNFSFFVGLFLYYRPNFTISFLRYFAIILFYSIWGIIHGNDYYSIIEDIMSFSPLILLFIKNPFINYDLNTRLSNYLANSLLFLIPISFVIFRYMDYGIGTMVTTRFNYDESTKLELFAPIFPILFAPYLIFFFEKLSIKQKFLVNVSVVLIALMGIITLSRSIVLGCFIPYILFYGHKYFSIGFRPIKFVRWVAIILLASILIYQTGIIEKSGLGASVEGIILRSSIQINETGDISTNRFEETKNYLNQDLSFFEYLFGRGMGGHKVRNDSDPYIGGVNMMHIGPSHVFLKGGILLLLVMYIPAFMTIIRFWKTPNYTISLILLYFLIGNFQTTNWSWSISLFFYWYGISYYYESKRNGKFLI